MTEHEAIEVLSNELEVIDSMFAYFKDFEKGNSKVIANRLKRKAAIEKAISALKGIQQYREIVSVGQAKNQKGNSLSDQKPCKQCDLTAAMMDPYSTSDPCRNCRKIDDWNQACLEKLKSYENAEQKGELIYPPCKIGDQVFLPIDFKNKVYTGTVAGFEYAEQRKEWVAKIQTDDFDLNGRFVWETFTDFGKSFFLDSAEAEKALKLQQSGQQA